MKEEIYIVEYENFDVNEIKSKFYEWIDTRKDTPRNFKDEMRLMGIKPYYIPCYVCNLKIDLNYNIKVQKRYKLRRGMSTITNEKGQFSAKDYPLFASQVIPRYDMDQIAPFDFSKMNISGYEKKQAPKEKFIQTYDDCLNHYKGAIVKNLEELINSNLLKENSKEMKKKFHSENSHEIETMEIYQVLVPIWVCKYSYKMETYHCILNGQNDKMFGHTPTKKIDKVFRWIIGILLVAIIIVFAFIYLEKRK